MIINNNRLKCSGELYAEKPGSKRSGESYKSVKPCGSARKVRVRISSARSSRDRIGRVRQTQVLPKGDFLYKKAQVFRPADQARVKLR